MELLRTKYTLYSLSDLFIRKGSPFFDVIMLMHLSTAIYALTRLTDCHAVGVISPLKATSPL